VRGVRHGCGTAWTLVGQSFSAVLLCTLRDDDPRPAVLDFDEPQAQLVEALLQQLALFGRQIAARLLLEQPEDVDHLPGSLEIGRRHLSRAWIRRVAEVDGGGMHQREHEPGERQRGRLILIGHAV